MKLLGTIVARSFVLIAIFLSFCLVSSVSLAVGKADIFTAWKGKDSVSNDRPDILVLAFNRNSSTKKSAGDKSVNKRFRVNRVDVKESEYANAVLKVMLKEIDITLDRHALKKQLASATEGQKAIYAAYHFHSAVSLGGFAGYLAHDAGNLIPETRAALHLIGANKYATLLKKALYVFADVEEMLGATTDRRVVLGRLSNDEKFKAFEKIDGDFESMENESMLNGRMSRYINEHPEQFFND